MRNSWPKALPLSLYPSLSSSPPLTRVNTPRCECDDWLKTVCPKSVSTPPCRLSMITWMNENEQRFFHFSILPFPISHLAVYAAATSCRNSHSATVVVFTYFADKNQQIGLPLWQWARELDMYTSRCVLKKGLALWERKGGVLWREGKVYGMDWIWDRRKQAKLKFAGSFIAIYDVFSSFSRVFN